MFLFSAFLIYSLWWLSVPVWTLFIFFWTTLTFFNHYHHQWLIDYLLCAGHCIVLDALNIHIIINPQFTDEETKTRGVTCPESHNYCIWNYLTYSDLYFYSLGNPFYGTFYHLEHCFWYLDSCIVPLKPHLPTLTLPWDLLRPLPVSQPAQFFPSAVFRVICFLFPTFSVQLGLPFCSRLITSLQSYINSTISCLSC